MARAFSAILLGLVLALVAVEASIVCRDENGQAVDWWFIHKLPSIKKQPLTAGGFGYYYADPSHDLQLSPFKLDTDISKALGSTLSQYIGKLGPEYLAWSDQPPGTNMSNNLAHAKGVMAFDGKTGFFLRHSTPRFPEKSSVRPYMGFPSYARIYGQTFLCVSYNMANLNVIASQFLVNDANIYDAFVSRQTAQMYPAIGDLAAGNRLKGYASIKSVLSLGGMNFTDVAKSKVCNCELYTQLVAPAYRSNMAVLSWGRPLMGSGCRPFVPYDVLDISGMTLNTPTGIISYNETKEHSKLGLAEQGNVVCVGDINRMTSQATRGGGTTCFSHASLWNSLAKEIGDWKTCSH